MGLCAHGRRQQCLRPRLAARRPLQCVLLQQHTLGMAAPHCCGARSSPAAVEAVDPATGQACMGTRIPTMKTADIQKVQPHLVVHILLLCCCCAAAAVLRERTAE